jgi:hypothetical protein
LVILLKADLRAATGWWVFKVVHHIRNRLFLSVNNGWKMPLCNCCMIQRVEPWSLYDFDYFIGVILYSTRIQCVHVRNNKFENLNIYHNCHCWTEWGEQRIGDCQSHRNSTFDA